MSKEARKKADENLQAVPVRESPATTSLKGVSGSYGGCLSIRRLILSATMFFDTMLERENSQKMDSNEL